MGGGVMRTAAKAAVFNGYRNAGGFAEAVTGGRRGIRPSSATVVHAPAVGDAGKSSSVAVFSSDGGSSVGTGIQRPVREFEDWEFATVVEADLFDALHPTPRVVFGPVPTLEEAREAASDLKEAIEKVYFSPTPAKEFVASSQGSATSGSSVVVHEVPKQVKHAFSLLQENQNVVASLASDKNVWDAIMKNEKVMEFYKNHESTVFPPEKFVAEDEDAVESEGSSETLLKEKTSESSVLWDFVNAIKLGVSEMVSNISDLLQDFMGNSVESASSKAGAQAGTAEAYAVGASFLALAVAAILVVLLKRAG